MEHPIESAPGSATRGLPPGPSPDATGFDVIVVGGGGSGLAAAVSAAQQGCSVLLLEKQASLGGTTRMSAGAFTASGTQFQRAAGIQDDAAAHAEDAAKFAPREIEVRNHAELRRFFLGQAAATLDWLRDLGLAFYGPTEEPPNRAPRLHTVVPGALAYIVRLEHALRRRGGVIFGSTGVEQLLHENGRVTGVRARAKGETRVFHARRGVVLAAGDYAGSPELLGEFKGAGFAVIEGKNPVATGDGHQLARAAGAALVNMDVVFGPALYFVEPRARAWRDYLPATGPGASLLGRLARWAPSCVIRRLIRELLVTLQSPQDAVFLDGVILLNAAGGRFCNETVSPEREIAVARQADKAAYLLFDERLARRYSGAPHPIATAFEVERAYLPDYLRLRPDIAVMQPSLAELANSRRLPPDRVRATVEAYNHYVRGAAPDPFGRTGDRAPLGGETWALLGPVKACFTSTEGGVAVNRHLEALDGQGRPIPGLYAVGQNGLGGLVLWSHGLHLAWALTSGRLVGEVLGRAPAAS